MNQQGWATICLVYGLGLVSTGLLRPLLPTSSQPSVLWGSLALIWLILGAVGAFLLPRVWRSGPRWGAWLLAGLMGAIAVFYLQLRTPHPSPQDISTLLVNPPNQIELTGQILTPPQPNRNNRIRFNLQVQQVAQYPDLQGKVYVTLPLLQGTGLVPQQTVTLTGRIYAPPPAQNPGGFDFQAYLARQGIFTGFTGRLAAAQGETPWGWWQLRQRIIRSQVRWLGSESGSLLSSMVLGRRAVDLSPALRDSFLGVGLAHTLAASGFHVSLLLGLVLVFTRAWGAKTRFYVGGGVLLFYLGLTGLQPSAMRAVVMGLGVLLGLVSDRQVKPLGLLLVTATGLLIFNPLWIWDLGFQLSFLATFGLLVTTPAITRRLDILPLKVATILAVPIAASLWTFPLLIYQFKTLPLYSLLVNLTTTPLISFISLGGMISGALGLIFPLLGSTTACLLTPALSFLIQLVQGVLSLPLSTWNIGKIALWQLLLCYGAWVFIWCSPIGRRRWGIVGGSALAILILPLWYNHATLLQVTVLATSPQPVVIIQEQDKVTLLHGGNDNTANYAILPFFREQGLNHINLALALPFNNPLESGWTEISDSLKVRNLFHSSQNQETLLEQLKLGRFTPLQIGQRLQLDSLTLQVLSLEPTGLQFKVGSLRWLLMMGATDNLGQLPESDVLIWGDSYGRLRQRNLLPKVLAQVQPKAVILSQTFLDSETHAQLKQLQIPFYLTGEVGAVQWTPRRGLESFVQEVGLR
ncbi:ComEC/Rec2 family competence protein [Spirulina subsalsa FACHB-351]|uniref:ComEC/Rec2 family competence protein n=1 Tax=Spirulina subsalsa FACHB-351 TaxID=234711 RepID=A0ABT3KZZ3_9CYAN|nr:ComEC/Rec2 family competence protein [Spirulina subsalsa]MCW6034823.1 ComEC/Rec2 family competence protein [Spirulina subsalsa FACHB-351]